MTAPKHALRPEKLHQRPRCRSVADPLSALSDEGHAQHSPLMFDELGMPGTEQFEVFPEAGASLFDTKPAGRCMISGQQ